MMVLSKVLRIHAMTDFVGVSSFCIQSRALKISEHVVKLEAKGYVKREK